MRQKKLGFLTAPYALWMIAFTVIPLLLVLYYAFTNSGGGFTFDNVMAITDPVNAKPLILSVKMSILITLVLLVLAYPLALVLSRFSKDRNSLIVMLFILPMWMNFLLRTLSWRLILLNNGFLNDALKALGFGTVYLMNTKLSVLIGTAYDYFPFMILPLYNAISKIDHSQIEAARDLGASDLTILRKIILPLSVPGIVSGITMVFVPSMSEFVIAGMLGGGKVYLIGNVIEQAFNSGYQDVHLGSGLSVCLMVFIVISMVIYWFFDREEENSGIF